MDRGIEDMLVPLLEAVGAPLTRAQIFSRVSDDVDDEEHLAKVLGRMCTDGTLIRRERPRFNSTPEFIYGTPKTIEAAAPRLAAIASAAKKVTPTTAREVPMPKDKKFDPDRFVEYLTPARGWINPKKIAEAIKVHPITAGRYLHELATAGRIRTKGKMRSLVFGSLELDDEASPRPAPEKPDKKKRRKPTRSQRLKAARPRPEAPAPQLPVPMQRPGAPTPDEFICCAIEDSGVVAITNGASTLRLSPPKIDQLVQFLERTQLIWKGNRT